MNGVEHDVVGIRQQLVKFVFPVRAAEHMHFPIRHLLPAQPGLVEAAGLRPRQILRQKGIKVVVGERFLRQQHPASAAPGQGAKALCIGLQTRLVHDIAGRGDPVKQLLRFPARQSRKGRIVDGQMRHQSTSTGLWLSLRGRP